MSENISVQALFTAGLTREQFIQKYSEIQQNNKDGTTSIFTEDFANSLGQIFDTLNTNGNETLDADEITTLQEMGDKDNTTLSEADLKALYTQMGKDIMKQYSSTSDPAEMYNTAMSNTTAESSTYIQDLNQQIATLQELVTLRQFNSTNIQQTYQSQIDDLIKKDANLTTEQKTEYIQISQELSNLEKEADKNSAEMKKVEEQLRNNENEIKLTQAELDKLDSNNEDDANSIAVWSNDLNRLQSENADLNYQYTNLSTKQKTYYSNIKEKRNELNTKNEEICANNTTLKESIYSYTDKISKEKHSSENEINTYKKQIASLQTAQLYAIEQIKNIPPTTINERSEASHQNDNLMSFDELKAMGLEYSSENGQKLAGAIRKHLKGFTGYCSRHVSNALAESGLGTERCGAAADMDTKLENNQNFKEIKVSSAEDLKRLPAGCILVYERGAARYNSKYGHIEVTLGDGTAGSDGQTRNIRYSENMSVFIPVKQTA